MISSLTLGLSEEDADNDIELAKGDPNNDVYNNKQYPKQSPPLDMLASLADHQQDMSQPSVNSWK